MPSCVHQRCVPEFVRSVDICPRPEQHPAPPHVAVGSGQMQRRAALSCTM
eukprot:CAMPEP_0175864340 /NCGR_PEP_ID=MMETSP0107_2-20121207/33026_1 /TAXON_ID=195067 ORGANISM="Goniomonas pacifica, Strain CCMP1869" /NCGR_SAMPLE_ID=MMETSP0107_2 /ASSEMBLY_ACC=CAM_ASM_000203 /LENGTH=49 /DNA_ID=CAMNT_0017181599 /DNA_START=190 /DNA_END=339 /DNA_ORIENTATION=+